MPRPAAVLALLVLALAGCGGGDLAYTEVESDPVALPIPQDAGTASADPSADDETTRDSDGVTKSRTDDGTAGTGTASGTGTSGTTTGGTTAPSTTAPSTATAAPAPAATTAPSTGSGGGTGGTTPTSPSTGGGTGGATPDGNDQFCADNPGACNGN